MEQCWSSVPKNRPSFSEIKSKLDKKKNNSFALLNVDPDAMLSKGWVS